MPCKRPQLYNADNFFARDENVFGATVVSANIVCLVAGLHVSTPHIRKPIYACTRTHARTHTHTHTTACAPEYMDMDMDIREVGPKAVKG